jgi:hypothetical protein
MVFVGCGIIRSTGFQPRKGGDMRAFEVPRGHFASYAVLYSCSPGIVPVLAGIGLFSESPSRPGYPRGCSLLGETVFWFGHQLLGINHPKALRDEVCTLQSRTIFDRPSATCYTDIRELLATAVHTVSP